MGIRRTDLVLAVVLTVPTCASVSPDTVASVPLAVVAIARAGLTLAVHRAVPWLPAVALLLVQLGLGATTPGQFAPDLVVLPVVVALALLSAAVSGPRAWVCGAATLALAVAAHVVTPDGDLADFWPLLVWGAPWVAGRVVRRVRSEAADRVARAEEERDRSAAEATAAERDRIARELHDVVAHAVSVMVVRAGGQRLRVADTDPEAAEAFGDIERAGREALTELRAMLEVLRDPAAPHLARHPLPDAADVVQLVERVRRSGREVRLTSYDVPADLPAGAGLALHRVVQECLTNALRHGTGPVDLAVDVERDRLHVRVANRPAADVEPGAGRGLVGMRERVRLLGGTFDAGPRGDRWVVDATLPLASRTRVPR